MGSAEGDRLRGEAGKLGALAQNIRTLLDKAITIAADKDASEDKRWQGPNAEKVRGDLGLRRWPLRTIADNLDSEAGKRRTAGTAADKPK